VTTKEGFTENASIETSKRNLAIASQFLYIWRSCKSEKKNGYFNFRPEVLTLSFLPVLPNFRFFGRIIENIFFKKGANVPI
jgi:hypothetical protein